MNFIQRNPNEPKHQEFHDGEYEYWPMDDSIKTKSISIPAALVSGLELLAAAAATGLLAVALAVMYVLSSPLAISENSAVINTNVYNNHENQAVGYTLSVLEAPEDVLQEGMLQHDEQTLSLWNLNGGTTYLLKYYDSEQNEVGQFQFTTPGEKQEPEAPEPSAPDEMIPSPTEISSEPADAPESETQASSETTPPEEFLPGIGGGGDDFQYDPVVPVPTPTPTPTPTPEPEPEPEPKPEPEPTPVPEAAPGAPELIGFISDQYISGVLEVNDLAFTERFVFINIPDENYEFTINQTGPDNYWFEDEYIDGTLTISITSALDHGKKITTEVTVNTSAGTASKKSILTPPKLDSAGLSVVSNSDGTYTFNITATTIINDNTDGIGRMLLEAKFAPYLGVEGSNYSLTQDPNNPTQYFATVGPIAIPEGLEPEYKEATAIVSGYWKEIGNDVFNQSLTTSLAY